MKNLTLILSFIIGITLSFSISSAARYNHQEIKLTSVQKNALKKALTKALLATQVLKETTQLAEIQLVLTYLLNYPSWYIPVSATVDEKAAFDFLSAECKRYIKCIKDYADQLKTPEVRQRKALELPQVLTAYYEAIIKELSL